MSQLNVDIITGKDGYSAPEFTKGLSVSGVVTATSLNQNATGDLDGMRNARFVGITTSSGGFSGNLTGNVTGPATLATALAINGTNQIVYQAGNNNSAILPTVVEYTSILQ